MITRTRFAPSPTGKLHLGNLRTGLFSWLYARHCGGEFILRIEDTDQERSTKEATKIILDSLDWLGLDYDKGPFYQSERLEHYRAIAEKLVADGLAYYCYCSKERITTLREQQLANKEKPKYDGQCRDKSLKAINDRPYVIRFKNPQMGSVDFTDQVLGSLSFQNNELDDLVIIRADGYPTYNFCVVIDDLDMQITNVIRGADHINNTPRQINIFNALKAAAPTYCHVPLILGNNGKLLSKRDGAASVLDYRDQGYLPEAMLNYLVRLGWSHGDQEIFTREEMIKFFNIQHINKAAAAFNLEKLLWLNRHYIKTLETKIVAKHLIPQLKALDINIEKGPDLSELIIAQRDRADTLKDMAEKSVVFYNDFTGITEDAKEHLTEEIIPVLHEIKNQLQNLAEWNDENLHQLIADVAKQFDLKLGKIAQPLRVAVTGTTISPAINITLRLLGKDKVLDRLNQIGA